MTPESEPPSDTGFARSKRVFLAAREMAASERAVFVTRECDGDIALIREVFDLLLHDTDSVVPALALPGPAGAIASPGSRPSGWAGPWRLVREIGRGGMGVVHLAERDGTFAAVKLLGIGALSPEARERFRLEADILRRLDHHGIARVLDQGEMAGPDGVPQPWIAMEYVDGHTLTDHAAHEALGVRQQLELLAAVCDAVQHAHEHGIVHRDLKPSNILVRPGGMPVVLDFGVARLTIGDDRPTELATRTGQLVGTPQYMSPEQVQGDPSAVGPASDVYSLGVLAYELLAGVPPYTASSDSLHRAVVTILTREPLPLGRRSAPLRGAIERIIGKALEKAPTERYDDAGELADDLRRQLEGRSVRARGPGLARRVMRWSSRRRQLVAVAAALVMCTLLGLTWWLAAHRAPPLEAVRAAYLEAETIINDARPVLYTSERTPENLRRAVEMLVRARARLDGVPRLHHCSLLERRLFRDLGTAQMLLGDLMWDEVPLRAARSLFERASNLTIDTTGGWIQDSPVLQMELTHEHLDSCYSLLAYADLLLYRLRGQHAQIEEALAYRWRVFDALYKRIGSPRPVADLRARSDHNDPWTLAYNDHAEVLAAYAEHNGDRRLADLALAYSDSAVSRSVAEFANPPVLGSLMFVRAQAFRTRGELTSNSADLDSALIWLRACGDFRLPSRRVLHAETRRAVARVNLAKARLEPTAGARVRWLERARHEVDTAAVVLAPVGHPAARAELASLDAELLIELARARRQPALLDSADRRLKRSSIWLMLPHLPHHAALDDLRRARLAAARVELGGGGANLTTASEILARARDEALAKGDSLVFRTANDLLERLTAPDRSSPIQTSAR